MRFVLGVVQYFDFTWEDIDEEEIGFHTKACLIEVFRGGLVVRSHGRQVDLGRTSGLPVWKYPGAYGVAVSNMIEGFGPSIKRLNSDRS
jgi:hypothetical protein